MKIEMGESLIYSWLRHEKHCQLAQNNWKASAFWELDNRDEIQHLMEVLTGFYIDTYNFDISKGCSLDQFLKQAEVDAIGISFTFASQSIYAVDVAFHEGGLSYGDKETTVMKIMQKCVRTALCLYGYFNIPVGEIIFASPKINPAVEHELQPKFEELTTLFEQNGLQFDAKLYCNKVFNDEIMQPIIEKGTSVADTSELFLRSIQMYQMFNKSGPTGNDLVSEKENVVRIVKTTRNSIEGKANAKIPKWAKAKNQINHRIIRAYYQLLNEFGFVHRPDLIARCQDNENHPEVYVRDFSGNFASMKTDKGNSHGRVFVDDGYNITIWSGVENTMEEYRSFFS